MSFRERQRSRSRERNFERDRDRNYRDRDRPARDRDYRERDRDGDRPAREYGRERDRDRDTNRDRNGRDRDWDRDRPNDRDRRRDDYASGAGDRGRYQGRGDDPRDRREDERARRTNDSRPDGGPENGSSLLSRARAETPGESESVASDADGVKVKRVPLSVEELLAKKVEEKTTAEKPTFLSKEDRARLALEKRIQEVEARKEREEQERRARMNAFNVPGAGNTSYIPHLSTQSLFATGNGNGTTTRYKNERRRDSHQSDESGDGMQDKELQSIRLYGRGHIAGIDIKEQKKKRNEFYEQLLRERRTEDERERAK
ncbi:DEAD (Asp-Glu-Ala-Asp) box polypeptide 23 [Cladochytrium tenue]|nr:DEAD (Asp-Glu-Ala-Asp) box polypeptide 23 [Cladochytrium tenue]